MFQNLAPPSISISHPIVRGRDKFHEFWKQCEESFVSLLSLFLLPHSKFIQRNEMGQKRLSAYMCITCFKVKEQCVSRLTCCQGLVMSRIPYSTSFQQKIRGWCIKEIVVDPSECIIFLLRNKIFYGQWQNRPILY